MCFSLTFTRSLRIPACYWLMQHNMKMCFYNRFNISIWWFCGKWNEYCYCRCSILRCRCCCHTAPQPSMMLNVIDLDLCQNHLSYEYNKLWKCFLLWLCAKISYIQLMYNFHLCVFLYGAFDFVHCYCVVHDRSLFISHSPSLFDFIQNLASHTHRFYHLNNHGKQNGKSFWHIIFALNSSNWFFFYATINITLLYLMSVCIGLCWWLFFCFSYYFCQWKTTAL